MVSYINSTLGRNQDLLINQGKPLADHLYNEMRKIRHRISRLPRLEMSGSGTHWWSRRWRIRRKEEIISQTLQQLALSNYVKNVKFQTKTSYGKWRIFPVCNRKWARSEQRLPNHMHIRNRPTKDCYEQAWCLARAFGKTQVVKQGIYERKPKL